MIQSTVNKVNPSSHTRYISRGNAAGWQISAFQLVRPDDIGEQGPLLDDCDLWVAKWMKDCKWGQDYRIEVGEQDRMKFTLYLVLDSHNIIKEKIIQHATANRKNLEDKQRRIVVPNWVSIFLALFFCVNNLCSFVVVWPVIVCLLHKHNYGSYPISFIFWQTYICRTLPNILLFNIM